MTWGSRKSLHKKPDLGNCREIIHQGYQTITMIYDEKNKLLLVNKKAATAQKSHA